jgi:uncharacterized protein (DUF983 family)
MLSAAMQGSPFSDLRQQTVPPALMSERVMPNISGPILWRPNQQQKPGWAIPSMATAILRGAGRHCPSCGQTRLFSGYLKVVQSCAVCGAPLGLYPSDDAPPYITILLVLHIIVPALLVLEQTTNMALWIYGAIFLPLTAILTMVLLPMVKGGIVGLLLKLGLDTNGNDENGPGAASR